MNVAGKLALVTGAASGIGRATACALARAGADLVVCDVNEEGLAETAGAIGSLGRRVLSRRVDVSRAAEVQELAALVHREHAAVDILVNNAGVGLGGGLLDTALEDWDWIVSINLWGVIYGCHYFVPPMVARGAGGHVVNVASAAGFLATAPLLAYATTKFAVFGLSEALRDELHPHGIGVTTICPGIINTPITRTSRMRGRMATDAGRAALVAAYERRNYGPENVAGAIVQAVEKNRGVVPVSPEAWAMYWLKRLSPGLTALVNRVAWTRFERSVPSDG